MKNNMNAAQNLNKCCKCQCPRKIIKENKYINDVTMLKNGKGAEVNGEKTISALRMLNIQ